MIEITIYSQEETESGLHVCYTVKSPNGTSHCSDIIPTGEDPDQVLRGKYSLLPSDGARP